MFMLRQEFQYREPTETNVRRVRSIGSRVAFHPAKDTCDRGLPAGSLPPKPSYLVPELQASC